MESLVFIIQLLVASFINPSSGVYDSKSIDLKFLDCKPWCAAQEINDSTWRTYTPVDSGVIINVYVNEKETSQYEIPIEFTDELVTMLQHADYVPN